jgi:hypothetical protein
MNSINNPHTKLINGGGAMAITHIPLRKSLKISKG